MSLASLVKSGLYMPTLSFEEVIHVGSSWEMQQQIIVKIQIKILSMPFLLLEDRNCKYIMLCK